MMSTLGLFLKLHSMGINAVGTIMSNRKGLSNMIKFTTHEAKTLSRGSLKMVRHAIEGTTDYMIAGTYDRNGCSLQWSIGSEKTETWNPGGLVSLSPTHPVPQVHGWCRQP